MSDATKHWHDLFRKECLLRQDDAARFGQRILTLEDGIEQYDTRLGAAFAEMDVLRDQYAELLEALHFAVEVIKTWHNMPKGAETVWQIYYDSSPEMALIREALAKAA